MSVDADPIVLLGNDPSSTGSQQDSWTRNLFVNKSAIPHLDPAIRARLQSALQRTDLKPTTRAKIEAALNNQKLNADE